MDRKREELEQKNWSFSRFRWMGWMCAKWHDRDHETELFKSFFDGRLQVPCGKFEIDEVCTNKALGDGTEVLFSINTKVEVNGWVMNISYSTMSCVIRRLVIERRHKNHRKRFLGENCLLCLPGRQLRHPLRRGLSGLRLQCRAIVVRLRQAGLMCGGQILHHLLSDYSGFFKKYFQFGGEILSASQGHSVLRSEKSRWFM